MISIGTDLPLYCEACPELKAETVKENVRLLNGRNMIVTTITCQNKEMCKHIYKYLQTMNGGNKQNAEK